MILLSLQLGVYLELLTLLQFRKKWLTFIETVNYNTEHFLAICKEVFKIHLYNSRFLLLIILVIMFLLTTIIANNEVKK